MTLEELWNAYVKKNPHWTDDGAKLTPVGLRKLFETTWDAGYKEGNQQKVSASIADHLSDALGELRRHSR